MAKRNTYRMVKLKDVRLGKLNEALEGKKVVVAIDVAKEKPVAALMTGAEEVELTIKWKQPFETRMFVEFVQGLGAKHLEVAMEPSGTYGDALRGRLLAEKISVFRVSPKRSHDAREYFDGVPSSHDAKSAAIIGKLHFEGRSEPWPLRSEQERDTVAAVRRMSFYEERLQRGKGKLEALLARHWPELDGLLESGTATQLQLLAAYGSARRVAEAGEEAKALMRKVGGSRLLEEKIEAVMQAARSSTGIEPTEMERECLEELCCELERTRKLEARARARVHALTRDESMIQGLADAVGKTTAAVLYAENGDPKKFGKSRQYLKSLGLNLKEKSSGKSKGALHITKRGSSVARQYLYLAALRKIKDCPFVRAWYKRKRERDGQKGGKAIVAIMRKLARALWHIAHGAQYDPRRLINVELLGLDEAVEGG